MQVNVNAIMAELAEAAKPVVKAIEAKAPTTKDRYGDYLSAITVMGHGLAKGKAARACHYGLAAVALLKAGGNREGIASALKVMGVV